MEKSISTQAYHPVSSVLLLHSLETTLAHVSYNKCDFNNFDRYIRNITEKNTSAFSDTLELRSFCTHHSLYTEAVELAGSIQIIQPCQ